MKRIAILSLPVLLLLLAPVAYAFPFADSNAIVTGTFSESINVTDTTTVGNVLLITDTTVTTFSGGMGGIAVFSVSEVVYLNGSSAFHASGTFVGKMPGSAPGTYYETYSGTGMGALFQGHGEVRDGHVGFAGLIGVQSFHGTYTSETTATGVYTLLAHL